MHTIDKHEPRSFVWKLVRKHLPNHRAVGMRDDDIWCLLAGGVQKGVQLFRHCAGNTRTRAGFAPAVSRAIIRANTNETGDLRLHSIPIEIRAFKAIVQDDSRSAFARAIQVQVISANIDEATGWLIELSVAGASTSLICVADCAHNEQCQ